MQVCNSNSRQTLTDAGKGSSFRLKMGKYYGGKKQGTRDKEQGGKKQETRIKAQAFKFKHLERNKAKVCKADCTKLVSCAS
jgi:hypothetical protein